MPAGLFVACALGDVAQVGGENRGAVDLERGDGQFDQNFRAVLAHTRDLDPLSDHRPLTCF